MVRIIISILFILSVKCEAQPIAFFHSHNQTSSYPLFLDQYPGAYGAYSIRKLRADYSGYCIRVRRSSDNTTADIGFNNNEIDTAALKSFVGTNDGYIYTWYDQSGQSRDWSQTTNVRQPKIIISGVIQRQNGFPTIDFGSYSDQWWINSPSGFMNNFSSLTFLQVARINNPTSSGVYIYFSNAAGNIGFEIINVGVSGYYSSIRINDTIENSPGSQPQFQFTEFDKLSYSMFFGNSTSMKQYRAGVDVTLDQETAMPSLLYNGIYQLGAYKTTYFGSMDFCEMIFYDTNKISDRTGMQDAINLFYSIN